MKKSVYLLGIVLAVLSVFFLFSCSNIADKEEEFKAVLTAEESKSERAYIRVNVENTDSAPTRTLLPKIEISNLVLTGSREGGEAQVLATASALAEMSAKQIEIQTGNWAFTLTATVSGVAYSSGEVSKTIESGGENPLSFTLEPADGATTGTLDFSLTFTGTEGVDYEVIVNDFPLSDTQKSGDTIIWKESGLTPGTHALKIEFRAKNANNSSSPLSEVLNTYKNVFLIEKGITTKAEVTNFNLNQVYSITYDGYEPTTNADVPVADALDPTDSVMTLKFSRKAGADTDGYITLPKLSNSTMTFSGWYTSADFAEASKVPESGTAPNTVQKIKVRENLANLKLYAKWMVSSNGTVYTLADYNFSFALKNQDDSDATVIYPGQEAVFVINPTITKKGTAIPLTITENGKTLIEEKEVTWTASLLNDAIIVADGIAVTANSSTGKISLTVPAQTYRDNYILKITSTYLGLSHDAYFSINISKNAINAAFYINSLTEAGEYTVEVEGAVGPGTEEGLAKVASAIKSRSSNVFINLDAINTSRLSDIATYNNGAYFKDCTQLKSIILPDWMQYVIPNLFKDCTNLTSVTLSKNTQWICTNAFNGCVKLASITIPAGITGSGEHYGIQAGAFTDCNSGFTITYQGTKEQWGKVRRPDNSTSATKWHDGTLEDGDTDGSVACTNGKCGFDYEFIYPVSSLTEAPTSGTYTLSTLDELKQIRTWVGTAPRSTLENVTFKLTDDIDTQGEQITIGYFQYSSFGSNTEYAFSGTLDGDGHKITNTIPETSSNYKYSALFYYVKGGTIKNLTVAGTSNRGSIIGILKEGTVENCVSETNITISSSDSINSTGEVYVGGIVSSINRPSNGSSVIKNCVNKGNITIDRGGSIRAGGIAGDCWDSSIIIDRCINKGNISVSKPIYGLGGIVGQLCEYTAISNCKNVGTITTTTSANSVGGIAGYLNNGNDASATNKMVLNCCNNGDVNSGSESSGLFGNLSKKPHLKNNCNSGTSYYGFSSEIADSFSSIEWITNNYCMDGSYTSGNIVNYSGSVTIGSQNVTTSSDSQTTKNSLNNWASTNSSDSLQFASWKLNAVGKPELDLGELDNK